MPSAGSEAAEPTVDAAMAAPDISDAELAGAVAATPGVDQQRETASGNETTEPAGTLDSEVAAAPEDSGVDAMAQTAAPTRDGQVEVDAGLTREETAAASEAAVVRAPTVPAEPEPILVRRTVSQEVARVLFAAGARFCFTVPGESFLPLIDDLGEAGIRVITTRHEGGAAFMAEALAQSTGRPQIVLATRAVGAANAGIGIHTAGADSAPLVALIGQVETTHRGREAFQESDLVAGIGSLATWAAEIHDATSTTAVLDEMWTRLTTGRPGPVLLSLSEDVLSREIEVDDARERHAPGARGAAADRGDVSQVLKWLAASERGVIVAGAGVLRSRATKRLTALSEALAIPVIAAWRRADVFPNDHANYLGMAGFWSASTVRERLADADAILFIGTRLSEVTTFEYAIPAASTTWAHVDLAPRTAHAGLSAPTLAIAADASRFLDTAWSDLRSSVLDNEMRERRVARTAADRLAFKAASDVGQGRYDGPGVHPGRIITALRAILPDNAVLTTDAGNLGGWLARGFRFRRAGTFLGPTSGAMGFGLPAAIAASLQDPDRIAVAVCGDGGFAMSMNELETAVREGAHPIALVFDNQRYGTIAMHQQQQGRKSDSSELGPIDFAATARAFGALGFDVTTDAEFVPAMREAITSRRPSVIRLQLDPSWVSTDEHPLLRG